MHVSASTKRRTGLQHVHKASKYACAQRAGHANPHMRQHPTGCCKRTRQRAAPLQIAGKRWKIDLHSKQEAGLLISAVNLPGGVQVRPCATPHPLLRPLFACRIAFPRRLFACRCAFAAPATPPLRLPHQPRHATNAAALPAASTPPAMPPPPPPVLPSPPRRPQRRRNAEDELNMRAMFREGDLISVSARLL